MNIFTPSPQQSAFFTWITNDTGSCVLEAVAGAGKTTTLIKALELMVGSIFFGAYNKKIAEEIQARAPKKEGLFISTMHAAGFKSWRRAAAKVVVDANKCRDIFRGASDKYPEYQPFEGPVLQLVSLAKQAAVGITKPAAERSTWADLIDHFDIECIDEKTGVDSTELIIRLARKTLERSVATDTLVVDFDDMIYAPLVHNVKMFEHDWVLIDEAQDTNESRRLLALRMLKKGGRLVAVGDRHQAIYGFTGADSDSLDLIARAVNAKQLPLTITYRCPKAVVTFAQQWVSHIQAAGTAPEGAVLHDTIGNFPKIARPGDVVLCRFNAPLIEYVYSFIAAGVPARVEGREIGNGLKALARRWKIRSLTVMIEKLNTYQEREVAKAVAKEQASKASSIEDKVNCLKVIIGRVMQNDPNCENPVERVCSEIDSIFSEEGSAEVVLFSSIHKSKGREWHRVIWLQTGPSAWARMAWEQEQEINLNYVAATRAKEELVLIELPPKKS